MDNRDYWNPVVLLTAGTTFGMAIAFSLYPILASKTENWLGFSGSVAGGMVGGILGIGGGWLAWSAVQDQIRQANVQTVIRQRNAILVAKWHCDEIDSLCQRVFKTISELDDKHFVSTDIGRIKYKKFRAALKKSAKHTLDRHMRELNALSDAIPIEILAKIRRLDGRTIYLTKDVKESLGQGPAISKIKMEFSKLKSDAEEVSKLIDDHMNKG